MQHDVMLAQILQQGFRPLTEETNQDIIDRTGMWDSEAERCARTKIINNSALNYYTKKDISDLTNYTLKKYGKVEVKVNIFLS